MLTQKLLKQGYWYHKLRKTFSKFYRRYYDLISKFQVGLKSLLRQGLLEPGLYGDLVYKLNKIVGSNNRSVQFIKIIGYHINVLQQTACYWYHKLRKTFSKFYRRYYDLISKFQVGLKSLLRQGLLEPGLYGDLVYKLNKIVGSNNRSVQFIKIIGYHINVLQQTACLVVNPITVGNFAFPINCRLEGRTSDSTTAPT